MKLTVSGTDRLQLDPAETAAALRDPAVLSRALPGDGSVERTDPGVATVMVTAGVAGTRGTYRARVHVIEARDDGFVLRIAAAGEPGTIEAELTVELQADGNGTRLDHHVTATLDGRLAGLGRKVLEGAMTAAASGFLAELERAARTPIAVAAPAGGSPPARPAPSDAVAADAPAAAHGDAGSPVRTALTAAAAGALATAGALRWWRGRQDT